MKSGVRYNWQQSHMGGGGYITGIIQNPQDQEILYARCDVAGVFKSTDRTSSWWPINNGMDKCHHHSVRSLAIHPDNPEILFRCSGEARDNKLFGSIHKTEDGGENWYSVSEAVDFYGNGPSRMHGEVIVVDPFNSEFVIAGGYSNGVWISKDCGENWEYSGLKDERINSVAIHPYHKDRIYVTTISDSTLTGSMNEEKVRNHIDRLDDYRRANRDRLYISEDRGQSWQLLIEGISFAELAFDLDDYETIYAACLYDGVKKSTDGGQNWFDIMTGLYEDKMEYLTISTAPFDSGILYTAPRSTSREVYASIPIFKSGDKGENWHLIKEHTIGNLKDYPDYITLWHAGWAIAKVRPDLNRENTLYFSNWYGVSRSDDGGKNWSGHDFTGLETTCIENVKHHPINDGKVIFTVADHAPEISSDNGGSYRQLPKIPDYYSSTAITASKFDPDFLLYANTSRGKKGSVILRSLDNGQNIEVVHKFNQDKDLFVQALAEDSFHDGRFYAYVDGSINAGAGLYRSDDWGLSWNVMNIKWPSYMQTLPHKENFIEAELLSVVVYQIKNVCGTNQLLLVDPNREDTIYLGEWTEGIYMSEDGGNSWRNIGAELPFQKEPASVLNVIKADKNRPGHIYAGFIREGLWRSENYGDSWQKIFPENKIFNANSIEVGGPTGNEIYVVSEPLYWSQSDSAVYYSPDLGKSWYNVFDKSLGAIRWKGVTVDIATGRIHGVSCGNGAFYADRVERNI